MVIETKTTFGMAAKIYLAIVWRALAIGIPAAIATGVLTAGLFTALGNDGANMAARIATYLVMIPVQILCIKLVIGKTFGNQRLVLAAAPTDAA